MIEVYYICTDKKAYDYALRYYKDKHTAILRCVTEEEQEEVIKISYIHQDKVFYFFGSCCSGFLKAKVSEVEKATDDYCEMFAIPHPEKISTVNHKPKEIRVTNPQKDYTVFARLHIKKIT